MNHHGYCSDYLNPKVFAEAKYENGNIVYGPMSYQVLIVCGMKTASPDFIDSLSEYAKSGGKVIFIDTFPTLGPGMKFKDSASVQKKSQSLLAEYKDNITLVKAPSKGDIKKLTLWTGDLLLLNEIDPGVKISNTDERLFVYQTENSSTPIFFFSNQNRDKKISFQAEFNNKGLLPWKWNAETGEKSLFSENGKNVKIELNALESLLLVFSEENGALQEITKTEKNSKIPLNNNWIAEFIPVEGESFTKEIRVLGDVTKMSGTENFGGTIIYRKTFESSKLSVLDLGKVAETAEVTLNGKNLGVKYWGERIFDISEAIIEGENELKIKVTTLLWNYCNSKTMEENPMAKLWANRNRIKSDKPLPTGLIGPVMLS